MSIEQTLSNLITKLRERMVNEEHIPERRTSLSEKGRFSTMLHPGLPPKQNSDPDLFIQQFNIKADQMEIPLTSHNSTYFRTKPKMGSSKQNKSVGDFRTMVNLADDIDNPFTPLTTPMITLARKTSKTSSGFSVNFTFEDSAEEENL
jgi:hypothetical protein